MLFKGKRIAAAAFIFFLTLAQPARAEDFAELTLSNIVKILVRFGVFDVRKDDVIDFYGKVTECQIFTENFLDDFKWNRIRAALRAKIKQDIAVFPTGIHYDTELQLGKYDFHDKIYRFSEKTAQFNANVFRVKVHSSNFCNRQTPDILPAEYKFVLDQPVLLTGLPMGEEDGSRLLARLREAKNTNLIIYTRFNMRVIYVAPIEAVGAKQPDPHKFALEKSINDGIRIDTRLDSIEYFEDPERTKLIYRFMP